MYRLNDILSAFRGVVGWEQDYNPQRQIDASLCASESGLTFQGAHPLCTIENVVSVIPDDYLFAYPEYSSTVEYRKGDKVQYNSKVWIAKQGLYNIAPAEGQYWTEYNMASDFISQLTDNGIKAAITRFIRDKVIGKETRNIIEKRTLFDGAGRIAATIENHNRIVGFEIVPLREGGITMKLEKVGLQFVGNTGDVTLYLFHSSCPEPVWSKTVSITKNNGTFVWSDLSEVYLPYLDPRTNAGGSWYLVYWQGALPDYMEAINFARDWSREPCSTCNKGDVQLYREMTKYAQVSPFCVDMAEWDGLLWDIADNIYTNTMNYGLNLQFSIGCDISDILISQRLVFADVIQKQVANVCLRTVALNPSVRVNRNQSNVGRDNILYELDGNGQGVKGLQGDLEKAYKALSVDMTGLDNVCLGCHTGGVKFRAI